MNTAVQAEKKLYNKCKALGISDAGFKWLDTALDPFKDITIKPMGYPDRLMAPSVIQTVHGTFDIKVPTSAGGGNWDCMIFVDQIATPVPLRLSPAINGYVIAQDTQSGTKHQRGGINVRSGPAGSSLDITTTSDNESIDPTLYTNSKGRVIGIGFEVHNTTSDLNRQGSVTTFRVCDPSTDEIVTSVIDHLGIAACTPTTQKAIFLAEPPATATEAEDLPGSVSWAAEKGCYVVPVFMEEDNIPTDLGIVGVLVKDEDFGLYYPPIVALGTITAPDPSFATAKLPTSLSGAFFTGLSPQTTLTLKYVYYFEQFPSIQSSLKRVASHSCPEDFIAIEAYTKIAKDLPTGVPVGENFLGAFIAGISRLAAWVLPKIPQMIKGVQAATAGISAVSAVMNNQKRLAEDDRETRETRIVVARPNQRNQSNARSEQVLISETKINHKPKTIIEELMRVNEPAPKATRNNRSRNQNNRRNNNSAFAEAVERADAGNRWIGKDHR
jgi:hypothetical protein